MYFARLKNVIPVEIATQIRDDLQPQNFSPATINGELNPDFRKNYDYKLNSEHIKKIEPFIFPYLPVEYKKKKLVGIDDNSGYALGYEAGNFFKMHTDGYSYNRRGEKSLLTIQIYLTDCVTQENLKNPLTQSVGGQTIFQDFETENHSIGDAVIFDHNLVHGGSEVIEGRKITIRLNAIYTNLCVFEDMNDHSCHLRLRPAVKFERKLTDNCYFKTAMDPMYDICTSCYGYTRIDEDKCENCNSKITIIPEIYEKRINGWFIPK